MTDAPLFTKSPATEQDWIEVPANSPFRNGNSEQSKDRNAWLQNLDLLNKPERSHQIKDNYKLTVVDIAPTVQEVCTYAPSGQSSCLVNPYLVSQLWLPALGLSVISCTLLAGLILGGLHIYAARKDWWISINDDEDIQNQRMNKRYELGNEYPFDCGDGEKRGDLIREGKNLWIKPNLGNDLQIFLDGEEVTKKQKIQKKFFTLTFNRKSGGEKEFRVSITR